MSNYAIFISEVRANERKSLQVQNVSNLEKCFVPYLPEGPSKIIQISNLQKKTLQQQIFKERRLYNNRSSKKEDFTTIDLQRKDFTTTDLQRRLYNNKSSKKENFTTFL
ncbi:3206_t:CDS:2 [Cetraspora pellucida]|uniref:3206_t:CDS:1 n=1 Tax=Cetraspora pellucida TaxID=1433469 RepID=A0A9N9F9B8_9GLOM|nr:3206_t:CDS:2 [Cetraspora pellucida]